LAAESSPASAAGDLRFFATNLDLSSSTLCGCDEDDDEEDLASLAATFFSCAWVAATIEIFQRNQD
jgi:hypothetical protein